MSDTPRIGAEPPPAPRPRSAKAMGLALLLVAAAAGGIWLAGRGSGEEAPPDETVVTVPEAITTTTAAASPSEEERVARAGAFWTALGEGDSPGAAAAVVAPNPGPLDLIGFVAALAPRFTTDVCRPADSAVACVVTTTNPDLLAIGSGRATERLLLHDDGWFDIPAVVGSAAARLSLYGLNFHTAEIRAACPLTNDPPGLGLAIVGSPTPGCGAYLAGLVPEYLGRRGTTAPPSATTTPLP